MNQRIIHTITILAAVWLCSCNTLDCGSGNIKAQKVELSFGLSQWDDGDDAAKSVISQKALEKLSDVNVFVFAEKNGVFVPESGKSRYFKDVSIACLDLDATADSKVLFLANAGEDLTKCVSSYADYADFSENFRVRWNSVLSGFEEYGMPMASVEDIPAGYSGRLHTNLTRLYSKWNVFVDCSSLKYAKVLVTGLSVHNSPKVVYPFSNASSIRSGDESAAEEDCDRACASDIDLLRSGGCASLYILENMQGKLMDGNYSTSKKTPQGLEEYGLDEYFDNGRLTFLTLNAAVETPVADYGNVTYRTFLGEDLTTDFSIRRNTRRNVTLHITGDKVREFTWRVEPDSPAGIFNPSLSVKLSAQQNSYGEWSPVVTMTPSGCDKLFEYFGPWHDGISVRIRAASQHTAPVQYRDFSQWEFRNATALEGGVSINSRDGIFHSAGYNGSDYLRSAYYTNECSLELDDYYRECNHYSSQSAGDITFDLAPQDRKNSPSCLMTVISPDHCSLYTVMTEEYEFDYRPYPGWYWDWYSTDYSQGHNSVQVNLEVTLPERIIDAVSLLYDKPVWQFVTFDDNIASSLPLRPDFLSKLGYKTASLSVNDENI